MHGKFPPWSKKSVCDTSQDQTGQKIKTYITGTPDVADPRKDHSIGHKGNQGDIASGEILHDTIKGIRET